MSRGRGLLRVKKKEEEPQGGGGPLPLLMRAPRGMAAHGLVAALHAECGALLANYMTM